MMLYIQQTNLDIFQDLLAISAQLMLYFTCEYFTGVDNMSISYNGLWKILIDKGINRTALGEIAGVSTNVIAKLGKGESVSLDSLEKICRVLNCNIGDVAEFCFERREDK